MTKYNSTAIFHLPGAFVFSRFYKDFLEFAADHPTVFQDIKIGSIYGAPYPTIWSGGRFMENTATKPVITTISEILGSRDIPIRLTLTNTLITEKHLSDTYSNMLVDTLNTGKNEILCNSKILEDYLRTNYPKYTFISSTTKRLMDIESIDAECEKDYKLVVIDYTKNKDFEFLKQLKHPEKIEMLCNAVCKPNCGRRSHHYENISKAILESDPSMLLQCEYCMYPFSKAKEHPHFISTEDINTYLSMGINNFKLEGRTTTILDLIEILVYYLVKPEYQEVVRHDLQAIVYGG